MQTPSTSSLLGLQCLYVASLHYLHSCLYSQQGRRRQLWLYNSLPCYVVLVDQRNSVKPLAGMSVASLVCACTQNGNVVLKNNFMEIKN